MGKWIGNANQKSRLAIHVQKHNFVLLELESKLGFMGNWIIKTYYCNESWRLWMHTVLRGWVRALSNKERWARAATTTVEVKGAARKRASRCTRRGRGGLRTAVNVSAVAIRRGRLGRMNSFVFWIFNVGWFVRFQGATWMWWTLAGKIAVQIASLLTIKLEFTGHHTTIMLHFL